MSSLEYDATLRSSIEYLGGKPPVGMLSSVIVYALFGAAIGFQCVNQVLNYLPSPAKYEGTNRFKWRNVVCSFLHAIISGTTSSYCIYSSPEMFEDLINKHTALDELLVAVSLGYFVYDFVDIITYRKLSDTWPILLHHVTIFCCFGITVALQQYIGYAIVALQAEVNSIFLHSRQIMLMMSIPKSSFMFFVNSILNILTFVLCRFCVLLWMAWWIYMNSVRIPSTFCTIGSCGLVIMLVVNLILFSRLVTNDLLRNRTSDSKKEQKEILDK